MYIWTVRVLKNTGHLFPKGQDTLPSYLLKSQCRQILGWSFPIHLKYDRGHTALTCVKSPSDGKLSPVYVPSNTSHTFRVVISRVFIVLRKKTHQKLSAGLWFNKKMSSYQYRKSHCGDKTILRPSYLHNGISYTGKTTSLYWIGAQMVFVAANFR